MEMMTPERQLINPFFTGGEVISVSFPTDTMTFEQRMMSMRGNNPYFSRGTVQHELLPGHNMQYFMNSRYKSYRGMFNTPFWIEGWSLYWELLLYDQVHIPKGRLWRRYGPLHLYIPPKEYILALKFLAGREKDIEDCRILLPQTKVKTRRQARRLLERYVFPDAQTKNAEQIENTLDELFGKP